VKRRASSFPAAAATHPIGERASSSDGFTLIEVLVALTILSISLVVLLAIFSQNLLRARENEDRMAARVLAQSLLAGTASSAPVDDTSGRTAPGMSWRLHVAPYGQQDDQTGHLHAATISAIVTWQEGSAQRSLTLTTLKLIPKRSEP
jgi:general secretion pathway protein I